MYVVVQASVYTEINTYIHYTHTYIHAYIYMILSICELYAYIYKYVCACRCMHVYACMGGRMDGCNFVFMHACLLCPAGALHIKLNLYLLASGAHHRSLAATCLA